jgi:purine-nucleoside phosphorylase
MYERLARAAKYIQSERACSPKVGLVLGSGLGAYVDQLEDVTIIPYSEIPDFHQTSVEGHAGRLIIGKVKGVEVVILQGRLHAYEGHDMHEVVFPIRVLSTLGIETLILTNAAGGVNESFSPGDLVLIEDHINLMGKNPLIGPNINDLGPRFPDMTNAYDLNLRQYAQKSATELGHELKSGVYCSVLGPTYETPAEVRMIRSLGGDMVGMSTVPESIAANHLGLKVLGVSCITNMAAGMANKKLLHEEIKDEALKVMEKFTQILSSTIEKINENDNT